MKQVARGFTLIEMAIVLVIIGLVIKAGIGVVGPMRDRDKAETTARNMALVEKALAVYIIQHGCLPCPANGLGAGTGIARDQVDGDYGAGIQCTDEACIVANAAVPWRTIQLAEENAVDGWGNRIRYGVASGTRCDGVVGGGIQSAGAMARCAVASYPAGGITVNDLSAATNPVTTTAAYVLISSGPDRSLALTQTEGVATANVHTQASGGQFENSDGDDEYTRGELNSTSGANHFDDIVLYRSAPLIIQLCGDGTCGNPA